MLVRHALHEDEVAKAIKDILASATKGNGPEKEVVRTAIADFQKMFDEHVEERQVITIMVSCTQWHFLQLCPSELVSENVSRLCIVSSLLLWQ